MADMDTSGGKRRRRRWPEALKREIVAAAFAPGASVAAVAQQYDVNANQVSGWRRGFSNTGNSLLSSSSMPGLVPVMITPEPLDKGGAALAASDTIEIEVSGDVCIRVGSGFDGGALKRVLDVVGRR